ncbi:unnamed protein product [Agarophyton chilense]
MTIDPSTVGTGYAFLDSLKGVVIGPTVNEITAAFAGGTVGVMGTIITLEVRRHKVKERKQCPYCRGSGKLPCATCYTVGSLPSAAAVASQKSCSTCNEKGFLLCNHCDGDGRLIPWAYERAIRAQYEDYVYTAIDDYFQDGPPYI